MINPDFRQRVKVCGIFLLQRIRLLRNEFDVVRVLNVKT